MNSADSDPGTLAIHDPGTVAELRHHHITVGMVYIPQFDSMEMLEGELDVAGLPCRELYRALGRGNLFPVRVEKMHHKRALDAFGATVFDGDLCIFACLRL